MQEESIFSALGLNDHDGRIYIALSKSGPTSIRQIAKTADINRGTTYETLKKLVHFGLVSFNTVGSRRKYIAEPPERLKDLLSEKQKEITKLSTSADKLINELLTFSKGRAGAPSVRFYEDDEGIVTILNDVLATVSKLKPKEYHVYSSRPLRQYLYRHFPNFTRRRIKEGIFAHVIAVGTGGDPVQFADRKFLEESSSELSSSYIIIYGNKLALISVSSDFTPYGVVIEEPGVAAMQRLLFTQLWQSL